MLLVDTSVWIDHLRSGDPLLAELLDQSVVASHDFVIGEIACGNLKNRQEVLSLLAFLPQCAQVTHEEVLFFIERHQLIGRGIDVADACLLAAAMLSRMQLQKSALGPSGSELLQVGNVVTLEAYAFTPSKAETFIEHIFKAHASFAGTLFVDAHEYAARRGMVGFEPPPQSSYMLKTYNREIAFYTSILDSRQVLSQMEQTTSKLAVNVASANFARI